MQRSTRWTNQRTASEPVSWDSIKQVLEEFARQVRWPRIVRMALNPHDLTALKDRFCKGFPVPEDEDWPPHLAPIGSGLPLYEDEKLLPGEVRIWEQASIGSEPEARIATMALLAFER